MSILCIAALTACTGAMTTLSDQSGGIPSIDDGGVATATGGSPGGGTPDARDAGKGAADAVNLGNTVYPATADPLPEVKCAPGSVVTNLGDYLTRLASCYFSDRAARLGAMKSPADVLARQKYVRGRVFAEIGGFPERTPLNPQITAARDYPDIRVENVIYESQPGFYVTANLYIPTKVPNVKAPFPAVLGFAGHGGCGKTCHLNDWVTLARRGFVVLAIDPPGGNERVELQSGDYPYWNNDGTEHIILGPPLILTGTNYARNEVWDAIRGIDYLLEHRADIVDGSRIGAMGISGGGTQTFYVGAFDTRVKVVAPASSMSSWPGYFSSGNYGDSEQIFTSFIRDGLGCSDFPLAFAPSPGGPDRAYYMVQGPGDSDFPIQGVRETVKEAEAAYQTLGQSEKFVFTDKQPAHAYSPLTAEESYRWFERWLYGRAKSTNALYNPDYGITGETLQSTKGRSVYTQFGAKAKTVQKLNQELAEKQHAARTASKPMTAEQLRAVIGARLLQAADRGAAPTFRTTGQTSRNGYQEEQLTIETEPGFAVRASLLLPSGTGLAAVLFAARAPSWSVAIDPDADALARAGYAVLVVEPRGSDLAYPDGIAWNNSSAYMHSMKALLLGKTLVGLRVTDILRAFDFLRGRPEIDPAKIAIFGRKSEGVAVLHAAALEPRIEKVAVEGAILSYLDVTRAKVTSEVIELLVPGVLLDYDLPDLAKAIAPRPVWIVSATHAELKSRSSPAPLADAQAAYGSTGARLLTRGGSFMSTYGEWLK